MVDANTNLANLLVQALSNSGITQITFLLSYGADELIKALNEIKTDYPQLQIDWILDGEISGTTAAVLQAVKSRPSETYALFLGDVAICGDFGKAFDIWKKTTSKVGFVCHPNLHPEDSDRFQLNYDRSVRSFIRKGKPVGESESPSVSLGGICFFSKTALEDIDQTNADITSALIDANLAQENLACINSSLYFKDSGTPIRLGEIEKDFRSGVAIRRGGSRRAAIFLDRDGTLVPNIGTSRKEVHENEIEISTIQSILLSNNEGIPIFLVSNQPGIAKGQISDLDLGRTQKQIQTILASHGALLDDFMFCPHHPHSGFAGEIQSLKVDCDCRKPRAGMLFELSSLHDLDLEKSWFIGDSDADLGAAQAAGTNFLWGLHGNSDHSVSLSIFTAIERIRLDNNKNALQS